ncbi:CAP domain-containing protein [Streptomyces sp. NBC_01618]|uniref:CAP domain-containing protein n=1 Tax=Streptomyces sp. NBC_01618 TaxID=2975900 RepID=UPI003865F0EA|nr:CAP domain-containing protein [Streptomyces sp. NBC_01618]
MGRHRRSAATPAVRDRAAGDSGRRRSARHGKRTRTPVRTGLIGVSAALAVGAVAVASGLLPGGDTYSVGGGPVADQVRTEVGRGGSTTAPDDRASASAQASRGVRRADGPTKAKSPAGSPSSATPSRTSEPTGRTEPSPSPTSATSSKAAAPEASKSTAPATAEKSSAAPQAPASSAPAARRSAAPAAATSAQAAVLALVNQERSKVDCSPVTASASLASLAQNFSDDMAARGFFDHTDPDGRTPWDRALDAGVQGLGGENIARGQADAQAVMDTWMNSAGHRANILNCDYKTLGVGVHFGAGGPWWTQDFGF